MQYQQEMLEIEDFTNWGTMTWVCFLLLILKSENAHHQELAWVLQKQVEANLLCPDWSRSLQFVCVYQSMPHASAFRIDVVCVQCVQDKGILKRIRILVYSVGKSSLFSWRVQTWGLGAGVHKTWSIHSWSNGLVNCLSNLKTCERERSRSYQRWTHLVFVWLYNKQISK